MSLFVSFPFCFCSLSYHRSWNCTCFLFHYTVMCSLMLICMNVMCCTWCFCWLCNWVRPCEKVKQWDGDSRCKSHLPFPTRRHSLLPSHHILSECWLVSCRIILFVRCVHNSIEFVTGIHLSFNCCAVEIALSALPHCTFCTTSFKPIEPCKFGFCPEWALRF